MLYRAKYTIVVVNCTILLACLYALFLGNPKGCFSTISQSMNVVDISKGKHSVLNTTHQTDGTKEITTLSGKDDYDLMGSAFLLKKTINSIQKQFTSRAANVKAKIKNLNLDEPKRKHEYVNPTCEERSPFLLIEVHSKPDSFVAREAIRLSWGRARNSINKITKNIKRFINWKTVFLVGKSNNDTITALMQVESQKYQDLVTGDFLDTYRNLTYKTLLTLEWPSKHCNYAKYIMKTDEDCYINVNSIIRWLVRYHYTQEPQPLYLGRIHWKNKPSRGKTSKYYVTMQEYRSSVYPPYAAGGGYVFTASLIPKLLDASRKAAVFPMEDAYLGTLMKNIGVKPTNHNLILPYEFCQCTFKVNGEDDCKLWYDDSVCNIARAMVVHGLTPDEQITTHVNVMTLKAVPSLCGHETQRESWANNNCNIHV